MKPLTRAELLALPPVTDLLTLGRALGLGESATYDRARRNEFAPLGIRVMKIGSVYRVPSADILRALGIQPDMTVADPAPTGPATTPAAAAVSRGGD
jgi:hypothetical protein